MPQQQRQQLRKNKRHVHTRVFSITTPPCVPLRSVQSVLLRLHYSACLLNLLLLRHVTLTLADHLHNLL
jgi:hypothetical protein